jgi:hypothetical protein
MPLPTRTALLLGDLCYNGEPFVYIPGGVSDDLMLGNLCYKGEPFCIPINTGSSFPGTGVLGLPLLATAGVGAETIPGTGAVTLLMVSATGVGSEIIPGAGALSIILIQVQGSGTMGTGFPGTGALGLPLISIQGTGIENIPGIGALALVLLQVLGTGVKTGDFIDIMDRILNSLVSALDGKTVYYYDTTPHVIECEQLRLNEKGEAPDIFCIATMVEGEFEPDRFTDVTMVASPEYVIQIIYSNINDPEPLLPIVKQVQGVKAQIHALIQADAGVKANTGVVDIVGVGTAITEFLSRACYMEWMKYQIGTTINRYDLTKRG